MDVRMPDGTIISGVPEGVTQTELLERYNKYASAATAETKPAAAPAGLESIAPQRPAFDPTKPLSAQDYLAAVAQRKEESPDRSASDVAVDAGITFLKGAIGLPESFVGLADIPTKGAIGKMLEGAGYNPREAKEILDTYLSEAQQAANRKVAETKGFLPTIGAALQNPSTIATGIGESLPQMLGGASVARGILAAAPKTGAVIAGGLGEGILGAGSAAEQTRGENADKLLTNKQALAALGSGAGTAAFGIAGGRLAQKFGLDDVDTMLASGASRGGSKSVMDFAKRATGSGISEGAFEEMPQSAQEKMWMNYATDKPLLDGVPEAMGMGLTTGFAMGVGGAGAGSVLKRTPEDKQREKYERPAPDQGLEALARAKGFLTPERAAPKAEAPAPEVNLDREAELRDLMEQTARAEGKEAPQPAPAEEPIPNKLSPTVAETQQPVAEAPVAEPVVEEAPVEAPKAEVKPVTLPYAEQASRALGALLTRQHPMTADENVDPEVVVTKSLRDLSRNDTSAAEQVLTAFQQDPEKYAKISGLPVEKIESLVASLQQQLNGVALTAKLRAKNEAMKSQAQEGPMYKEAMDLAAEFDALKDSRNAASLRGVAQAGRIISLDVYKQRLDDLKQKRGLTDTPFAETHSLQDLMKVEGVKGAKKFAAYQKSAAPATRAVVERAGEKIQQLKDAINAAGYGVFDINPTSPQELQELHRYHAQLEAGLTQVLTQHNKLATGHKISSQEALDKQLAKTQADINKASQELRRYAQLSPEIREQEEAVAGAKRTAEKTARESGSLWGALTGRLDQSEVRDIFSANPSFGQKRLQIKGGKKVTGAQVSDIVADGGLDQFLPPDMRHDSPTFDEKESTDLIKQKIREEDYLPFDTKIEIEQIFGSVQEAEKLVDEFLTIEEQNLELQTAADEQRESEIDAQEVEPGVENRAAEPATREAREPEARPATEQRPVESERVYLNVPFKENERAKQRGALWDAERKLWYMVPIQTGMAQGEYNINLTGYIPDVYAVNKTKDEARAAAENMTIKTGREHRVEKVTDGVATGYGVVDADGVPLNEGAVPVKAAKTPAELELSTQTAEELKSKQDEIDRLTKENERLAKQAEAKAKADAERDEFVLTGSDRPADVAAAQGQKDIFGAMEEEAPVAASSVTKLQKISESLLESPRTKETVDEVEYEGETYESRQRTYDGRLFGSELELVRDAIGTGNSLTLVNEPTRVLSLQLTGKQVGQGRDVLIMETVYTPKTEKPASNAVVTFVHKTDSEPGKGQRSGYYPGTYSYEEGVKIPELFQRTAKNAFVGSLKESEIYTLKDSDKLKREASKAGFEYRQGSGDSEVRYLQSQGYKAMRRDAEIIVFDAKDANFKKAKPEVASEVVGPAEKPAAPQLTREPVTIEGEFTEVGEEKQRALITTQAKKLSEAQTSTLEKFYGFARDTEEFADALRQDVVNFITKGATYVNGKIRAIIRSMANGVLSVAVAFNPQFVSMPYTIAVPQYETRIEQVMQEVPASVQKQMSDDAKRAYATIYPAIKAELQANDKFFIVADKQTANTFVFNPDGSPFMNSKTLFGIGIGDFMKGDNNIVANRITPAGLFNLGLRDAKRSAGEAVTAGEYDFGKVFVLDKSYMGANGPYSNTIMHSVWTKETDAKQRLAALQKPGAEDSRYSFGCINVDKETYGKLVTNNLAQMDGAKIFIVPENGTDVMSFVNGEATYSTDIIRQRAEPVTKETKQEVQRAAEAAEAERTVVGKEEEGPMFNSIEAETAGWSPARIDQLINEFGYTDGRTFGMAGYVNPADFVKATTPTLEAAEMLNEEAGELDAEAIRAQRQTPFLFWDIDKGAIIDHEGRHRMAALARAGVTRAPVVLVVKDRYGSKKPDQYKPEYGTFLSGQRFQDGKGQGLSVKELIPLSYKYKEQLGQEFGKEGFLYSLNPEKFLTSDFAEEKKRSPSFKRRMDKLNRDRLAGKITDEEFVNQADWALKQSEKIRLSKEPAEKQRGYLELVNRLSEAAKRGDISVESFELATWFMRNNPDLVEDLGVRILGKGRDGVGGQYSTANRVMVLIKGGGSDLTVTHEILHHLERMMPPKIQQAIRTAWAKQLAKALKNAKTPGEKLYFKVLMNAHYGSNNIDYVDVPNGPESVLYNKALGMMLYDMPGSKSSFDMAETLLKMGAVPISNYQFFNPSEFWAVNGSQIVQGRFEAVRSGTLARLKNWLKELGQKIKSLFGMKSHASIIRALDSLSKADGQFVTEDMLGRGDYQSVHRNYRGNAAPASAWTSMDESILDNRIYDVVDKHIDTKRVIENIRKTSGAIAEDWDAYTKEELYHGRTAKAINDFLDNEMLPITKEMKENNVTLDELDQYLHNRHAEERNEQINRINPDPKLQNRGSGISTADAAKYLANLPTDRAKVFEDLAAQVDSIIQKTQKILVDSGMETQDTINAWNQTYEHYVPLQRDDLEYVHTGAGISGGYATRGKTSKRATGSLKSVVDIFENIAIQRERAVMKAERARVGRALYGLAIKYPNPEFWLPVNPDAIKNKGDLIKELVAMGLSPMDAENLFQEPTVSDIDKKTGMVKYVINQNNRYSENVFPVRINGQDRFIIFNGSDPRAERMVRAMKNLDAEQLGVVVGTIGTVTRFLASVNTQYNPVFGAWNFLRDVQGAALNLSTTEISGHEKEVLEGISPIKGMPALRAIYRDLRGKGATTPEMQDWIDLFEQYQKAGGATGYKDQFSKGRDAPGIVERELTKLDRGNVRKAADAVFNWLSDYNDAMENAVRLSAFKVALDQGFSEDKAASIAKNLTVNFNRKGAASPTLQALYAFFNASVQGTARLAETLRGPAGRKIMAGGFMIGVAQAIALAMAGFDDDDPPEFLKNKNLIIPTTGGNYLIVPMPMGFNIFPGIGRLTTEYMLGQGGMITGAKGAGDKIVSAASLILDSFNPLGSGSLLQMIAPTPADPLVAIIGTNRDAFGRPIAKEDRATSPTPGYTRSRENASYVSKKLAEFLNYVSSPMGTKYTKGAISPTADQLDYLAGQIGGGVSRELLKTGEYLSATVKGETSETPSYRVPILGKLYGETETPAAISAKFYQNVTLLAEMENEIKSRQKNKDDTKEYRADHPESRLINRANYVENQITALNKQKKLLQEKGAPDERIKAINEQKTRLMKGLNDQIKKIQQ